MKTGGLSAESLGVLRSVAAWREEEARSRDLPRGWVMKDQSVLEIARRRPANLKNLKQIRSLKPHQVSKDGESILHAVRKGLAAPVEPQPSQRPRLKVPPQLDSIARLLEAWVYARATEAEIAPSMLASRGELKNLAIGHYHSAVPELRVLSGWRLELVGQDLLDLLDGKKSMSVGEGHRILAAPAAEG